MAQTTQNPRPSSTNLMKLSSIFGVSLIVLLLDWFFVTYATSHGLQIKTQSLAIGGFNLQLPLQWLPVIGVLLVSLVGWYDVSARIFPRRAGPEVDPLANARIVRVIAFSLMAFVCVLYLPYILGSNWFWTGMSRAGRGITQLHDFGISLLHNQEPIMILDPLWQYSIAQILAAAAMVFVGWLLARTVRRPRRPR